MEIMEESSKLIEGLLERATEYGKSSYELIKLKAIDKTSDVVSSVVPNYIILVIIGIILLFLNLGLALWLGAILGEIYYGFFIVSAFYVISGIVFYFFLHDPIKKLVCNFFIKQIFK
jgi:sterol desaturase/sphingolipid hydroxylase (fatty acid hydroxylase superfamily)